MTDKDLLLIISEILIKQDQTNEVITGMLTRQDQTNEVITGMLARQDQTNEVLQKYIDISVKQFEEQAKFNSLFLDELKGVKSEVVGVKEELVGVNQRLDQVEKAISALAEFDDRLKRIEAIVLKP